MALLSRLRLIQFRAAYNLPVLAGIECGIFARYGLEIEAAHTPGSDFLIAALEAGKFEIGHTAADDVLAAAERNPRCELFLCMGLHSGLLSLVAGPDHHDVKSLRGELLGVDSKSTGFVFLLQKFLRSKGVAPDDSALVEIGGWEQRCRALLEKRIAATLLTSPYVEEALDAGCQLLASGNEIEGVYQATCGVAARSWATQKSDLLIAYIRAYVTATRWCFDRANRSGCLHLLNRHMGIDEERGEKTLATLLDPDSGLYPRAELNLPGLAAVLALRKEMNGLVSSESLTNNLIDSTYYQSAMSN